MEQWQTAIILGLAFGLVGTILTVLVEIRNELRKQNVGL